MARNVAIRFIRTSQANLDSQASTNGLLSGEPYLITDSGKLALALTVNTYTTFLKTNDDIVTSNIQVTGIAFPQILLKSSSSGTAGQSKVTFQNAEGTTIGEIGDLSSASNALRFSSPIGHYHEVNGSVVLTLSASQISFSVPIVASGKLSTFAANSSNAGFRLTPGVTPNTLLDGDMWCTTSGLFARINGAVKTVAFTENLGTAATRNIHVGTTAPVSPAEGDIWIDTN